MILHFIIIAGNHQADIDALMAIASDYIAEALDKKLGGGVTDNSIFRAHAAKYEVRALLP